MTTHEVLQRIFDQVWQGLASQDWHQSMALVDDSETCAYRGSDGRRCAVGWLIPDEIYSRDLEGMNVASVIERVDLGVPDDDEVGELLVAMQGAHDHIDSFIPDNMRHQMEIVAQRYGLRVPNALGPIPNLDSGEEHDITIGEED